MVDASVAVAARPAERGVSAEPINEEFVRATIHMLCVCVPSNVAATDADRALKAAMLAECTRAELREVLRRARAEVQRRKEAGTWSGGA
jgi:DNA invertase Pin-like site-specific DNA recombinase